MKNLILLSLLLISSWGFSQSNQARDMQFQTDFEMQLKAPNSSINISKYKTDAIDERTLILKTVAPNCKMRKGIKLKLTNGEVLNFKDIEIICSSETSGSHLISGSILLNKELDDKFSQSEISEFMLGDIEVLVDYDRKIDNLKGLFELTRTQ